MDPFDSVKAMMAFWTTGVQGLVGAQQEALAAMTPNLPFHPTDAQGFESARNAYGEAWRSAQAISAALAQGLQTSPAGKPDPMASGILAKIFDPQGWLSATGDLDRHLASIAEGPRLADFWNIERKYTAVLSAWFALRRRQLEHSTLMLQAWTRATDAFSGELKERADASQQLESGRDLMALWVETANTILIETQGSDPFLTSQREMLKAATDLRLAQREISEFYADMFGLPTRAELDDVHLALTELRREVRASGRRRALGAERQDEQR